MHVKKIYVLYGGKLPEASAFCPGEPLVRSGIALEFVKLCFCLGLVPVDVRAGQPKKEKEPALDAPFRASPRMPEITKSIYSAHVVPFVQRCFLFLAAH